MLKHFMQAALSVAGLVFCGAVFGSVPGGLDLYASSSPDRADAYPLDGTSPVGNVYIFVESDPSITRVQFYVDGVLLQTERVVPYDFAGTNSNSSARPFDISGLSTGSHRITAQVYFAPGTPQIELIADIVVTGQSNPPLPVQFLYSSVSDRSAPQPLLGSNLSGEIYAFVENSFEIQSVEFYIDGNLFRIEDAEPFDLAGGINTAAEPFDLGSLAQGQHQFLAKVLLRNGTQFDLSSMVTTHVVDTQPPVITAIWSVPANNLGWNNTPVTITPECLDAESGIARCAGQSVFEFEGVGQTASLIALDVAGHTTTLDVAVNIDLTSPELAPALSQEPNNAGWHKASVTVQSICTDALSGVATCSDNIAVTQDGVNQLQLSATDNAGNESVLPLTVQLDSTPPNIIAQPSIAASPTAWFGQPVTFQFTCSDEVSGISMCPEPIAFTEPGRKQSASAVVTDVAGNASNLDIQVNLDFDSPQIAFLSHSNNQLVSNLRPVIRLAVTDQIGIDPASVSLKWGMAQASCQPSGAEFHCQFSSAFTSAAVIELQASAKDFAGHQTDVALSISVDADLDMVADYADECADSALGESVNEQGCDAYQRDTDGDGYTDAEEQAAGTDPLMASDTPALLIVSFSSSTVQVPANNTQAQLNWHVQGPATVSIKNDANANVISDLGRQGTVSVAPLITTRYTLLAESESETQERIVVIEVLTPPPAPLWIEPTATPVQSLGVAASLVVADDGTTLVGDSDGGISKLSTTGDVEWTLDLGGMTQGTPLVVDGVIYVGVASRTGLTSHGSGMVKAVGSDGATIWQADTEGAVIASPVLGAGGNTIFAVTYAGFIYAVDRLTGSINWSLNISDAPIISAPTSVANNQVLVKSEQGELIKLDVSNSAQGDRVMWRRALK
ncbi:hypothetical protein R50072_03330 [Simiduia litorea]|uniref:outer membrane protein assembly factor BamB family protein n=1 Tax=Simiduia litorea TaxID=1435348 RepID=UPI0036F44C65